MLFSPELGLTADQKASVPTDASAADKLVKHSELPDTDKYVRGDENGNVIIDLPGVGNPVSIEEVGSSKNLALGGDDNYIAGGSYSVLLGGTQNALLTSGNNCGIYGGSQNTIQNGFNCFIIGSQNCVLTDGCVNVTLVNCKGLVVPAGTKNVTFINNNRVNDPGKAVFLRAGGMLRRPLVFPSFGGYNNGWSDGSALAQSFSFEPAAPIAASAVQLLFGNFSLGASYSGGAVNPEQQLGKNPITVKAGLYNGEGFYPLTFNNGQLSARILPGLTALTDRFPRLVKPGAGFTLLRVSVAVDNLGDQWPLGLTCRGAANGDVAHDPDTNYSGAVPSYHPLAIIGDLVKARTYGSVALVGDSIFVGGGGADLPDLGWGARALNAANIGWTRMATYGALLDTYTRLDKPAVALPAISGVEHVLCDLGVNNMLDLLNNGLDAMKTRYLALWAQLGATGAKVHQSTITPYINNPTPEFIAVKAQLNDWIRSVPAGLTSCVDAALAAETAKNSNLWKPGYTNDNLHPNETGAAAIAAAVNPNIFLL